MSVLGMASAHAQVFPSPTFDNSATITQTGNRNSAEIDQAVDGVLNGQGSADIVQTGNANTAVITQTNATNPLAGRFANTAQIDQLRARGDATINQIHDYLASRPNVATIVQATPDAQATIQQRGDRNTATIRQFTGAAVPIASIDQNGRFNTATVRQRGDNSTVEVLQGTFSDVPGTSPETFTSRVTVDSNGLNANVFISQIGFDQLATVTEDGTNGSVNIQMDGASNDAIVTQSSTDGTVEIVSTGTSFSNLVTVNQEATDVGSSTRVTQTGSFAEASITQLDALSGGGENVAEVEQTGMGTGAGSIFSSILQDGGANTALVTQASALADSTIVQTGIGHTSVVSQ
jgi:hypothetical protein